MTVANLSNVLIRLAQTAADEEFLLALLNSRPMENGEQCDELATRASGLDWLGRHDLPRTNAELASARMARDVLGDAASGILSPGRLGALLSGATATPRLDDELFAWHVVAPSGRRAAVRAALAWDAIERARPHRLRACANAECTLFFVDRSKPNSARWCSMATCGNRAKARRHAARARSGSGP